MKPTVNQVFGVCLLSATLQGCGGGAETNTDTSQISPEVPVSDWQLVWSDEFDTDTIDANKWLHEVNCDGGGNNEQQCYTASNENSYIENGILHIVALPAAEGEQKPYTSARLSSKNKADFKYGRFEVRAKLPSGQGSWPAFWLLPTDEVYGGWPNSGEIDVVESVNLKAKREDGSLERHVYGTLHYGKDWPDNESSGKEYLLPNEMNPADDFHTYAIEWQEGEIRWYVDGYLYQTQRRSQALYNGDGDAVGLIYRGWFTEYFGQDSGELETHWDNAPYDQEFHMLLNLAVGGNWPESVNELGVDASAFADGQHFEIDYVRVYQCQINPETGKGCDTVRGGFDSLDDALVEGKAPTPIPPSTGIAQNLDIFTGTPNPSWPAWDCCGGSTPALVDDAEKGAVYEFAVGESPTVNGFISREAFVTDEAGAATPFDASPLLSNGTLSFDMKVVSLPSAADTPWLLKVESVDASSAVEVPLTTSVEGQVPALGQWQTYTFPLQALANGGLSLSAIDAVMIFPTWGSGEGAVYQVTNMRIASDNASVPQSFVIFEEVVNPAWPLWDCCGGTTPQIVEDDAEHGNVAEFSVGSEPTVLGFISRADNIAEEGVSPMPFDASSMFADGMFQFEMKVVNAPANSDSVWKLKIESNNAETAAELDLTNSIEGLAPVTGEWQTYTFKLADLASAGLDVSTIDVVMIFPAWGTGEGALYRVDNLKFYQPTDAPAFEGHVLFQDDVLAQWSLWDCCGGTTPTIVNDDAQHGITAEYTIGAEPTVVGLFADDGVYLDSSAFLQSGVIQFEMKVVNAPANADSVWKFKIESMDATTAVELDLSASIEGKAPEVGQWQTYTYSLQSLVAAGLDVTAIDVVMVFPAWGTGEGAIFRLDNVLIYNQSSVPQPQSLTLFKDGQNSSWPIWDCCGGSTPSEQQDDAEHGATAEFSIGAEPTVMGFLANEGAHFDASALLTGGVVRFDLKVVNAPNDVASTWKFKIESLDAETAVELDLSSSIEAQALEVGQWQTYTYSLQALADAGLDLSKINVVMVFPAWGTGEGAVYRIDNAEITVP
ncbi:glycoside hydrolase family 16 protein [Pseudoalteromonas luteoviolacea]|uniref:GH16 domain-containing protein n=1 Tax=Pseudoalteromonas luteoviolacea S4060-1 TaxID=1365257 RepID=A0A167JV36_9GAMM|nr:hypothetical protein N478_06505 [Pseudoalteromonas luteoviolacea S4060-1]